MKLISVIGEINNQNEKYIDILKLRFELVLNSYKILYIRKLASLILSELYNKQNDNLLNVKITVNEKDHIFTACLKDIIILIKIK